MNGLSKFLVEGILNEVTEKVVALFGGGFKPPTKGHLEVVNQGLQQSPEVTEVKILVGGGERDGFTQRQAVKIWNLYNDIGFISKPATVIPVSSPFKYYKEYLQDNPEDKVYVFIGSRPGDDKDQFDVKQRSEYVKKYSDNVIPTEVATTGGVSGTEARKLFKTDIDSFRNMFPENLTKEDFKKILNILGKKDLNEGDPKKGTGKKPKGSGRRLYTDEDPKDTVGVKFSTRQDIVDTLNKKSFKSKSHARQSQIINLIHQRVRAAYGRAKDPAVKKRLKTGLDYITDKKEASKKKTQRMKKKKLNEDVLDQTSLVLPRGKTLILQAEDQDYDRGLGVKLLDDGGYKIYYWYTDPKKMYPIEVLLDGDSIKEDAREIVMKFHPQLEKENIDPASQKKHKGKAAPFGSAYEPLNENATYSNKTEPLTPLNEGEMSMDDFNLIGAVLRDKNKSKEIHNLLLQMFPKQKELLNYNYKNDSYAEFKRVIFHIDKYKIEGPKIVQHTKLKLDPEIYKERDRKYEEYAKGKIKKYFRDSDSDPRTLDLSKMPPITMDSNGEVMDGNHRAFLAIKQQKPLKAYQIIDAKNTHPNVKKILNIVGRKNQKPLNENATYSSKIDYKQQIKDLTKHMIKKGMNILPLPRVIFKHSDTENASQFLGKTAYYTPSDMTVVLYTEGRHPKDIVRSFAHEMIHHIQNLEDRLHDISTTNTMQDDHLNDIEREAYTKGNMVFRNWTDNMDGTEVSSLSEKKKGFDDKLGKDPFGLNQYARELMEEFQIEDIKPTTESLEEQEEVRIFNKDCGCDKT